eukprot:gb/GFBE01073955.1/.p1 GENE.gb/GFBE01073955.1/~~gb/GFBE01073955.1/.p1  ORF type:complete len:581 (+),score=111.91 gb/GFBE01073955.1/:1-1743(+)
MGRSRFDSGISFEVAPGEDVAAQGAKETQSADRSPVALGWSVPSARLCWWARKVINLPHMKHYPELCGYDEAAILSGAFAFLGTAEFRRCAWIWVKIPQPTTQRLRQAMMFLLTLDALLQRPLAMVAAVLAMLAVTLATTVAWRACHHPVLAAGAWLSKSLQHAQACLPTPSRHNLQRLLMAVLALEASMRFSVQAFACAAATCAFVGALMKLARGLWPLAAKSSSPREWFDSAVLLRVQRHFCLNRRRLLLMAVVAEVLLTLASRPRVLLALLRAIALLAPLLLAPLLARRLKPQAATDLLLLGKAAVHSLHRLWSRLTYSEDVVDPWLPSDPSFQEFAPAGTSLGMFSRQSSVFLSRADHFEGALGLMPALPSPGLQGISFSTGGFMTSGVSVVGSCASACSNFASAAASTAVTAVGHGAKAASTLVPQRQERANSEGVGSQLAARLGAGVANLSNMKELAVQAITRCASSAKESMPKRKWQRRERQPASSDASTVKKNGKREAPQIRTEARSSVKAQSVAQPVKAKPTVASEGKKSKAGQKRELSAPNPANEERFAMSLAAALKRRKLCARASAATK